MLDLNRELKIMNEKYELASRLLVAINKEAIRIAQNGGGMYGVDGIDDIEEARRYLALLRTK